MFKMPKVRVYNPEGEGWLGTRYEIDGKEIPNVVGVDCNVSTGQLPHFLFHMCGVPNVELSGNVMFEFTPTTIAGAEYVIRNELRMSEQYKRSCIYALADRLDRHNYERGKSYELAKYIIDSIVEYGSISSCNTQNRTFTAPVKEEEGEDKC